jgi:Tfp pilus assembly protein PilN
MRAVNLLPKDATQRKKLVTQQNLPQVVGAGLGIVVTGALALSFMNASGNVKAAQAQLDEAKTQLQATPKPAEPEPVPNAQLVGEQSARVTAVSTAIGARMAWDRLLREFSLVLPDDVWIDSLGLNDGGLTISGQTYSHDSVARLLSRLVLIPELTNVTLGSSAASAPAPTDEPSSTTTTPTAPVAPAGPTTVHFSITAMVTLPAGAPSVAAPPPPAPVAPTETDTTATDSGATS